MFSRKTSTYFSDVFLHVSILNVLGSGVNSQLHVQDRLKTCSWNLAICLHRGLFYRIPTTWRLNSKWKGLWHCKLAASAPKELNSHICLCFFFFFLQMNFSKLFLNELLVPLKGVRCIYSHFFPFFSLWVRTWGAYLIPNDNFLDKKSVSHYIWGCSSADFPILTIIAQTIKYLSTSQL